MPQPSPTAASVHAQVHAPRAVRRASFAAALLGLALITGVSVAHAAFDCAPAPRDGCHQTTRPHKSRLMLRNGPRADKHTLVWKWYRGDATPVEDFGSPMTTDGYALCVYDASQSVELRAVVPAGGQCSAHSCWNPIGDRGFRYRNGQATAGGLTKIRLYAGAAGKARIIVKGRGANLKMTTLPLALPVLVQLQASNGQCWEAPFDTDGVAQNDSGRFGGRSGR